MSGALVVVPLVTVRRSCPTAEATLDPQVLSRLRQTMLVGPRQDLILVLLYQRRGSL